MTKKSKTTKTKQPNDDKDTKEESAPPVVRRPGDGSRMLSAEEVEEQNAGK